MIHTQKFDPSRFSSVVQFHIFYPKWSEYMQVALTLHGFTLYDTHFTRGLYFCQINSHYVMLYTVKKLYLSIKGTVFHFTQISLFALFI